MNENNRNLILAIVLSAAVLFGWQYFVGMPQMTADRAHHAFQVNPKTAETAAPSAPDVSGAPAALTRAQALKAQGASIAIDTPSLDGSIRLKGAQFNNLHLKNYRETIDPSSPAIALFAPQGTEYPYYAVFGWVAALGEHFPMPGEDTPWTQMGTNKLTLATPVTLKWDNGRGLLFTRIISVDANYMLTVHDTVANHGADKAVLYPYAYVRRIGTPPNIRSSMYLHEGFVGISDGSLKDENYDHFKDNAEPETFSSTGGWLGFRDKYWLAAVIPPQDLKYTGTFNGISKDGKHSYQADYRLPAQTIAPGREIGITQRLFAGAKIVTTLKNYERTLGIQRLDLAIDWGWFWFFAKPIFLLLDLFYHYIGNFGLAIMLLTVAIKLVFFPLANTSYKSMSRMRKLQPEMERIKQRFAEDRVRQQQEIMELYKREKVNPVSGCLPMLLQIPVFIALYQVLYVTIEMRHAPFFGWIHDLSAPDPTSILNLFGLLPYSVPSFILAHAAFLSIGIWPVLMGITQWLQTKLNPAPADPVQARMFAFMPLIFTFMLATFPAGLVIYWTWNNLLSVTQQYIIMRRQGVKVHLFENLKLPKRLTAGE